MRRALATLTPWTGSSWSPIPDGTSAWVPSKKDNVKRGTLRSGGALNHQNTVRAISSHIDLGTNAQIVGQVTFTISYVVVIVRGRLVSIGKDYEEAAADLGAPPRDQLTRVLLPLLAPAIIPPSVPSTRAVD